MAIKFEINRQAKIYISHQWIKQVADIFSSLSQVKNQKTFSLAFVDASTIKKINARYLKKNKVTDVLSFDELSSDFVEGQKEKYLGEIIICVSQAKKQAKEFGHSLKYEITRLLVHGLAHLLGYEHERVSSAQAEKMVKLEKKVMNSIFKRV